MKKNINNLTLLITLVTKWMQREKLEDDYFLEILLALHLQGYINLEELVWVKNIGEYNEV